MGFLLSWTRDTNYSEIPARVQNRSHSDNQDVAAFLTCSLAPPLTPSIPKVLHNSAQGCEERATLGPRPQQPSTLKGVASRLRACFDEYALQMKNLLPNFMASGQIRGNFAQRIAPRFGINSQVIAIRVDRDSLWPAS